MLPAGDGERVSPYLAIMKWQLTSELYCSSKNPDHDFAPTLRCLETTSLCRRWLRQKGQALWCAGRRPRF